MIEPAALAYAEIGLHVIPIEPRGKKPIPADWVRAATTDPVTIGSWFANAGRNIGIVCGPSGIAVVDIDPRNGGSATFAALVRDLGPLPRTVAAETGGGGWHVVFRRPAGVDLESKLGAGVDLLHGGRQIIVEPSIHPNGRPYRWIGGCAPGQIDLADLPAAWIERATRRPVEANVQHPASAGHLADTFCPAIDLRIKRARAYLARKPGAVQHDGGSIATWNAVADVLLGFDLPEDIALQIIAEDYNPRCSPPWSERELRHKVASVARRAERPRGYLLRAGESKRFSARSVGC